LNEEASRSAELAAAASSAPEALENKSSNWIDIGDPPGHTPEHLPTRLRTIPSLRTLTFELRQSEAGEVDAPRLDEREIRKRLLQIEFHSIAYVHIFQGEHNHAGRGGGCGTEDDDLSHCPSRKVGNFDRGAFFS
jgi:hypothetical protein